MRLNALIRWRGGGLAALLLAVLLLAWLSTEKSLPADAEAKAAALPADLARIPTDGMLVCSIRIADLWSNASLKPVREKHKEIDQAAEEFEKRFGLSLAQVERLTIVVVGPPPGSREPVMIVRTTQPYKLEKVLASDKKFAQQNYKGETIYVAGRWNVYPLDDRSLVYSEFTGELHNFIDHPRAKEKGVLADALQRASAKHALVLGVNVKQFYDSSEGNPLPPDAEPFRPLFLARWLTLVADLGAESRLDVSVHFANEKDAKAAVKPAQSGLALLRAGVEGGTKVLGEQKDLVTLIKQLQAPLKAMQIERQGETLQTSLRARVDLTAGGAVLVQMVQKVREAAGRAQSQNNLHNIAIALQNYADTRGERFPAQAVYNKDGKPLLSWRVMILPYIDQQDLYKQFHLNEPWDSEHNKKLLAKMPRIYALPQDEKTLKQHTTYYQGFVGKGAFFEGKQGLRFPADFPDGTSNTMMIVEASKAVPWTKPEDISYDPEKPLPKLGLPGSSGFNAAICDGSVRLFTPRTSQKTLRLVITRNDGQPLGDDY